MTHHHMIQYPGTNQVESVLEGGRKGSIGLAGLRVTGGMVMNQNYGRGIVL